MCQICIFAYLFIPSSNHQFWCIKFCHVFLRQVIEIWMFKSIFHRYTFRRIKCNHSTDKIQSNLIEILKELVWNNTFESWESLLVVWQLKNTRPNIIFICGSTVKLEYFKDLINFRVSHKEGLLFYHL